jgi:hypothetical protein
LETAGQTHGHAKAAKHLRVDERMTTIHIIHRMWTAVHCDSGSRRETISQIAKTVSRSLLAPKRAWRGGSKVGTMMMYKAAP